MFGNMKNTNINFTMDINKGIRMLEGCSLTRRQQWLAREVYHGLKNEKKRYVLFKIISVYCLNLIWLWVVNSYLGRAFSYGAKDNFVELTGDIMISMVWCTWLSGHANMHVLVTNMSFSSSSKLMNKYMDSSITVPIIEWSELFYWCQPSSFNNS